MNSNRKFHTVPSANVLYFRGGKHWDLSQTPNGSKLSVNLSTETLNKPLPHVVRRPSPTPLRGLTGGSFAMGKKKPPLIIQRRRMPESIHMLKTFPQNSSYILKHADRSRNYPKSLSIEKKEEESDLYSFGSRVISVSVLPSTKTSALTVAKPEISIVEKEMYVANQLVASSPNPIKPVSSVGFQMPANQKSMLNTKEPILHSRKGSSSTTKWKAPPMSSGKRSATNIDGAKFVADRLDVFADKSIRNRTIPVRIATELPSNTEKQMDSTTAHVPSTKRKSCKDAPRSQDGSKTRKPIPSDPVALYRYYEREWDRFRQQIPGENIRRIPNDVYSFYSKCWRRN